MYSKAKTCHDSFPTLRPIDQICSVSLGLTPFLSYPALQVTPILPNYAQLCWRVPFQLLHSQVPEPSLECTPPASGMPRPSKIMWSSCDDRTTMCYWCHLIGRPLSQWTWDLGGLTLFIFHSIFILWHAYTFVDCSAVLVCVPVLTSTWRLIVCAPVPCSPLCPLHPHVDSHPSYKCPLDPVLIAYLCL